MYFEDSHFRITDAFSLACPISIRETGEEDGFGTARLD